ncbi:MAG: hypothetical protein C0609_03365 [Deltaproteobacteria bacterium]|nr:MAG: hypothetical protein C0609_03365 [Deltaproteobacteria bacterium]
MIRRLCSIALTILLGACLTGGALAAEQLVSTGNQLPRAAVTATLEGGRDGIALLESRTRVKVGFLEGGAVKSWNALSGSEGAVGIASDETGLLFVVLHLEGELWLKEYRGGVADGDALHLDTPGAYRGVAGVAAGSGIIWVTFKDPAAVLLFAYDGEYLSGITKGNEILKSPLGVALGGDGTGYVTDPMGPSLLRISNNGELEVAYDLGDTGITRPTGVAVDEWGYVWVTDGISGRVARLEYYESGWDLFWPGNRKYKDPVHLHYDAAFGKGILLVEGRSGAVRWLEEYVK